MSEAFEDREKGYEAKFRLDQEQRFKAQSRRNKLLGLWLAEKFGMTKAQAEAYAKEVVLADLDKPGAEDVIEKVMKDIEQRKADITEQDVREQMEKLYAVAVEEIAKE